MGRYAIRAEGLGKQYRIGGPQESYKTLRDSIANALSAPFRRASSLLRGQAYGAAGLNEIIWALKDISFEVQHGEVVGIIGRNGAGKSTLLKVLSRITEPTEGEARVRGRVGSLLEVGTGFHGELTGRENVFLNGAILGMHREEIQRKFDEIVDFSGVEKFIDTPVKHYSSGMHLRLGFAVAAHLEPDILVIDEVLAVGDAEFQKKCLGKMEDVAGEGRTVLFVSHNMAAVQNLCSRGILLKEGQIVMNTDVADVISYYVSDSIQNINVLEQRMDRQGNGEIKFVSVCFEDADSGNQVTTLISGQSVRIKVNYRKLTSNPVHGLQVSIGFFSTFSQFMFACNSAAINMLFDDLQPEGTFVCEIPRWPLTSGIYTYNLMLRVDSVNYDWVRDAGSIQVETGDFYGTGRISASSHQGFLIDYHWFLEG